MKIQVEPRPLERPIAGGEAGSTVSVEPLRTGDVLWPRRMMVGGEGRLTNAGALGFLTPRSRWMEIPCPSFLIRHPTYGPFLVDTGLHPSVTSSPSANLGRMAALIAKPELPAGDDLPAQLRARGVEAQSVPLVVMTHLHLDHTSGMAEFQAASFLLSTHEWHAATTVSRPAAHGYRPQHYDYAFDFRTLNYSSDQVTSYATFGRTFDLFGDGSVRLAFTPGHTLGHQSVICRLKERDLVIAGDSIYLLDQLEDTPLPPRPEDPHTFRRSLQELRLFHRQFPQAVIIPSHDPDVWATLEDRYE